MSRYASFRCYESEHNDVSAPIKTPVKNALNELKRFGHARHGLIVVHNKQIGRKFISSDLNGMLHIGSLIILLLNFNYRADLTYSITP